MSKPDIPNWVYELYSRMKADNASIEDFLLRFGAMTRINLGSEYNDAITSGHVLEVIASRDTLIKSIAEDKIYYPVFEKKSSRMFFDNLLEICRKDKPLDEKALEVVWLWASVVLQTKGNRNSLPFEWTIILHLVESYQTNAELHPYALVLTHQYSTPTSFGYYFGVDNQKSDSQKRVEDFYADNRASLHDAFNHRGARTADRDSLYQNALDIFASELNKDMLRFEGSDTRSFAIGHFKEIPEIYSDPNYLEYRRRFELRQNRAKERQIRNRKLFQEEMKRRDQQNQKAVENRLALVKDGIAKTLPRKNNWHSISKDELHELSWKYPLTHLAIVFGVSDRAIKKKIDKFGIEKPPRGHFLKTRL